MNAKSKTGAKNLEDAWRHEKMPVNRFKQVKLLLEHQEDCYIKSQIGSKIAKFQAEQIVDSLRKELEPRVKVKNVTKGEFIELSKIAVESGVIDYPSCGICYKILQRKRDVEVHMKFRHGKSSENSKYSPDIYDCFTCEQTFASKTSLNYHIEVVHNKTISLRCNICNKEYKHPLLLKSHMKVHDEKEFKCKACDKSFRSKAQLNIHYRRKHCDTTYDMRQLRQDSVCDENYKCMNCEEIMSCEYDLYFHYTTNECIKPYKCDECQKTYKSNQDLKVHKKMYHSAELLPRYFCGHCENSYAYRSGLNKHMRNDHKS